MRKVFQLTKVVSSLFGSTPPPFNPKPGKSPLNQTTIRIDDETENFVKYQAELLGLSKQDMMAIMLKGVAVTTSNPNRTSLELAFDRFMYLLHEHKIPQIHASHVIESISGNDFPIACISNQDRFFDHFSPGIKGSIADFFSVDVMWLEGESLHPHHVSPIYSRDITFGMIQKLKKSVSYDSLEPGESSILVVKNTTITDEGLPEEVIIYQVQEWHMDSHMHFKTMHPMGIFHLHNQEALICLRAFLHTADVKLGILLNGITIEPASFHRLKVGSLPSEVLSGHGFPTIFKPAALYENTSCPETLNLIELLST